MKKNNPIVIAVLIAIIVVCAMLYAYNYWQKSKGLPTNFQPVISSGEQTAAD